MSTRAILTFKYIMMSAVKNVFKSQMEVIKGPDFTVNKSGDNLFRAADHLSEVIENADGVPYQLIFGHAPGEGKYIHVGDGIRDLLGIEPGAFTEKAFTKMIEQVNPLAEYIPADIFQSRSKFVNGEFDRYKADLLVSTLKGDKKWVRDSSLPLKDEETGKVIGSFGILFDVSDRKKISNNLLDYPDENDRLKNAFLHNISHEVRTPLNAIVGFSALLCDPGQEYGKKREFYDLLNDSTDHFLAMMDSILEISRLDAGIVPVQKAEVNPLQTMTNVYNRFRKPAEEKGVILTYNIINDNHDSKIITDGFKLLQSMCNLLDNALKFTFRGRVEFGLLYNDKRIEFYVSDTGIGIEERHKDLVFNKFYQAESGLTRRFSGVGLGLSITKAYIEMLSGSLSFTSTAGEGSTFTFSIPL